MKRVMFLALLGLAGCQSKCLHERECDRITNTFCNAVTPCGIVLEECLAQTKAAIDCSTVPLEDLQSCTNDLAHLDCNNFYDTFPESCQQF